MSCSPLGVKRIDYLNLMIVTEPASVAKVLPENKVFVAIEEFGLSLYHKTLFLF